jgi:solute carrier family 25 S-adenosylmethionine transporter 26
MRLQWVCTVCGYGGRRGICCGQVRAMLLLSPLRFLDSITTHQNKMEHFKIITKAKNSRCIGKPAFTMVFLLSSMMLCGCFCDADRSTRISIGAPRSMVDTLGGSTSTNAICSNRERCLDPWIIRGGGGHKRDASSSSSSTEEGAAVATDLSGLQLALAGAVATMVGDVSMHPIDCIKTLQQSNEGIGLSMLAAAQMIWKTKHFAGFFSGLNVYMISDGLGGALKFATYETLKRKLVQYHQVQDEKARTNSATIALTAETIPIQKNRQSFALFGIAALSYIVSSVVLVPGELIKQRLQMGQISSISQGISSLCNTQGGLLGLYQGYFAVCLRDIPYTMLELGLYDNLKAAYQSYQNGRWRRQNQDTTVTPPNLSLRDEVVIAAITGCITGFVTNPLDTIKTKLMVDDAQLYHGFIDCLQKTVSQYGLKSLLQGAAARVSWIGPFTAIYLPIYEILKRQMTQKEPTRTSILPPVVVTHSKSVAVATQSRPKTTSRTVVSSIQGGAQMTQRTLPSWIALPNVHKTNQKKKHLRLESNECFVSF